MTERSDSPAPSPRRVVLTSLAILGAAALVAFLIHSTEPAVEREGAVKKTAMLVEVTPVERGTWTPTLVAMGRVRASQDLALAPRVSGQVTALDPGFVPGEVVAEGTVLVRLDPTDARAALTRQRSALQQAEAELALEQGRQAVARIERDHIDGPVSAEQESLILRQPQLSSAQARVDSARTAVRQAELELARTEVLAPFEALVTDRAVSVGSLVDPGSILGRLVAVDRFWVELTLPANQLRHLAREGGEAIPVPVALRDRTAWQPGESRTGHLEGVVRQLDEQTRLARVLVVVDDPLGAETDGPALLAGAWVEARIPAAPIAGAVRLPRGLLRKDHTVWVNDGGVLRIREVTVALQDAEYAYVTAGLDPEDLVVTTNLSTVTDGAPLRTGAAP